MQAPNRIVERLERTPLALRALAAMASPDDARWRNAADAWAIVEIVRHMGDEEVDDFRARLRNTLEDPERAWAPIDPEGWARDRKYIEDDLTQAVERFCAERSASMIWLRSLGDLARVDWTRAHKHPKFGPISAGDLLASWAAHDALHLRQIAKRLYELAQRDAAPAGTRYAGEWGS